jgi:NADH-quinone oxidoreductase subunit N
MLCAAISVYYYFKVIQAMYFKTGELTGTLQATPVFRYTLLLAAAMVVFLGIMPQWLLQFLYF